MAEHTPGPWHWNGIATIWNTRGNVGEVEREVIIAQVVTDYVNRTHVEPIPVIEANARLIAAAPELLAALEEVVRISDRKHNAWDAAHAAIAKAKGT